MISPSEGAGRTLSGRSALVTGGARGIGRAVCLALARAGAFVAPVSRNQSEVLAVIREAQALGGRVPDVALTGDVRKLDDLRRIVEHLSTLGFPPDILVTAAGIAKYTEVASLDPAEWQEHLDTNLTGVFNSVRAVLPGMLDRGQGDIVTIGSVASIKAFPKCGAYSASKFGVLGFTRVLREEVRARGVRVSCILPGATETPLWGDPPPVPGERMMPPEAVAEAVRSVIAADARTVIEEVVLRPALGDL